MKTNFNHLNERFHSTNENDHDNLTHMLGQAQYYTNRELSWLAFNERVLDEAKDISNPLLERLKFLAIFSSNLDEFFMVRVANLQRKMHTGLHKVDNKSRLTPDQQIEAIVPYVQTLIQKQSEIYHQIVTVELPKEGIRIASIDDLTVNEKQFLADKWKHVILPKLTRWMVDTNPSFPLLPGKCLHLSVRLDNHVTGIVHIPFTLERLIRIPSKEQVYIFLEDIIIGKIQELFPHHAICSAQVFRLTRSADDHIGRWNPSTIIQEIEEGLKRREWGAGVRLETQNKISIQAIQNGLFIDDNCVFQMDGRLDLTFLFDFIQSISAEKSHLLYEHFTPRQPQDLCLYENIFEKALRQDLFFHHPYESFVPIIDFITEAANDPEVLEIKQTLYRVSNQSPIIQALKQAAKNGKRVTVLIELKARFDEANNLFWVRELKRAGCFVIYHVNGLKTHSKITLVSRRRNHMLEHFVHIGTGNYNDETAKLYTDMGILTANKEIGEDAVTFFDFLSGRIEQPTFHHLVISPFDIRQELIDLIDEEIKNHLKFGNGCIRAKMNALTDKKLIIKLYEASIKGVKIDLIVRGICCLKPGMKGISENIRVRSIVGRFLEHSRVYWFHGNGKDKMYISSADLMTRNMVKRIEILLPVQAEHIKQRIQQIIQLQLHDRVKARVLDYNGEYHSIQSSEGQTCINSQEELLKDEEKTTMDQSERLNDVAPHNRRTII